MHGSSSLIDHEDSLILDTSVLINLHACKCGERIITAIPNNFLVPKMVEEELDCETSRRNGDYGFLHALTENGIVTIVSLTDAEYSIFHELTSAIPSLDDGEATTIAIAASRHLRPVIDERKGRKRASALMQGLTPHWSLDLFRHPTVIAKLGDQRAVDALYYALRHARMRIPPEKADDVIALVGTERSRDCTCLPGYRERFTKQSEPVGDGMT
jgi:predicted nucleic acid-binding protein